MFIALIGDGSAQDRRTCAREENNARFTIIDEIPSEAVLENADKFFPGGIRDGKIVTRDIYGRKLNYPFGYAIFNKVKRSHRTATIYFRNLRSYRRFIRKLNKFNRGGTNAK